MFPHYSGDGDRNMILGKKKFVTPSDSVAIISANAQEAIPYFRSGPKVPNLSAFLFMFFKPKIDYLCFTFSGFSSIQPTSGALDRVAEKLGLTFFEVSTFLN